MIKVIGNTFPAKDLLKSVGFEWSATEKAWFGSEAAKAELDRVTTASYSRANQKKVLGLRFEEISK